MMSRFANGCEKNWDEIENLKSICNASYQFKIIIVAFRLLVNIFLHKFPCFTFAHFIMKARTLKPDKVNIITLGCSKNLVDSEVLSGQLKANEINVVHENGKLDHNIVVVNTCGFIDKAKEESINTILAQTNLKKLGKLDKVYVTGRLSERYRRDLESEIPEVDAWFGTLELPLILREFNAD